MRGDCERHDAAAVRETAATGSAGRTTAHPAHRRAARPSASASGTARSRSTTLPELGERVDSALARDDASGYARYSPLARLRRASAGRTARPASSRSRARRALAGRHRPKAADTGGPVIVSSRSSWRSAMPPDARGQAAWRAEALDRGDRRDPVLLQPGVEPFGELTRQPRHPRRGQLFDADLDQQFPIHRPSRARSRPPRLCFRPSLPPTPSRSPGQLPHAQDVGHALGHADAAARVEQVEHVRALQTVVERRQIRAPIAAACPRARVVLARTGCGAARAAPPSACRPGRTRTSTARPRRGGARRDTSRPAPTRRSNTLSTSCSAIARRSSP